jgi:hypothetical protein
MTQFNPQNKDSLTYGECLNPIFKITEKEDAMQYKRDYIAFIQKELNEKPNEQGYTAEEIANKNIGYYAGYGSAKDRERIEDLFECKHPIFGSIKENGQPSVEDAFSIGIKKGLANRKQNKS